MSKQFKRLDKPKGAWHHFFHSSQKSKGVKYKDLKKTYQITFSTHSVFPKCHDFISWFTFRTKDGYQLSDQINMIIIELDKLKNTLNKPTEELTSQEKWSLFLQFAQDPMHRDKINDIIKEKEEIGMAATLLQEISKDERERAILRSRRMYETDRESDRLTSEEIGEIRADKRWQIVVADKDAIITANTKELADKDAEIMRLKAELEKRG
ncbi:MAG: PD-(D/E)XK nuclease family transposase [Treponema sp.]|nr:PD-(D/E)XK nuclease family transposase [Treponema sp.]